jgi:hypothetical protein
MRTTEPEPEPAEAAAPATAEDLMVAATSITGERGTTTRETESWAEGPATNVCMILQN